MDFLTTVSLFILVASVNCDSLGNIRSTGEDVEDGSGEELDELLERFLLGADDTGGSGDGMERRLNAEGSGYDMDRRQEQWPAYAQTDQTDRDVKLEARASSIGLSRKDIKRLKKILKYLRCQSGVIGKKYYPGALTNNRDNSTSTVIPFDPPFLSKPAVTTGVTSLDANTNNKNLRYSVNITEVTQTYATVNYYTWSDTKIYTFWVNWMACP